MLTEKSEREACSDYEGHENLVESIRRKLSSYESISEEDRKGFEALLKSYLEKVE